MSNLLSVRREVGEFRKRYKWMALFVVATFGVLFVRAIQLQLVEHEKYAAIARENITKTVILPATRGIIRDTKGQVITTNRPSYNVYITPQLLEPRRDAQRIAELMGLDAGARAAFEERLAKVPERRRTHHILMFSDISRDQLAALETHSAEVPGMDVVSVPVRTYPFGGLSAHAIGYLNEVNADDLKRLKTQGYGPGDVVGRSGIERAWESYLRGRHGFRRVLVDSRGQLRDKEDAKPARTATTMRRDPMPGRDLALTLDMGLMQIVDRAFRGHPSGAAVVVDVHTGRVRALYSKPSYDLNEMSGHLTADRVNELEKNPFRPLIDKTIYDSYFPGSTFKPISAIAALQDSILSPSSRVDCKGHYDLGNRRFRCNQAHGEVEMKSALVQSCNVYFYRLAEQVGLDRLAMYAREFGFGTKTGIGINTESNGFIPTRAWYTEHYGKRFRLGFTLNAAIGQGNTKLTLIQLAMAYGAIANGGTLYFPQLVEKVSSPDGTLIEEFPPRARRRIRVSPEHLALVVEGLKGVVNDSKGTAYDARIQGGVTIAGKTGTAQISRRSPKPGEDARRAWYDSRDHAWFAGFAPAEAPQVAIVILVEHGGGGGKNAAPIAVEILQEYLGGSVDAARAEAPSPRKLFATRGNP